MSSNITIINETVTDTVDYTYTIPEKCVSLALRADGDVLVNVVGTTDTWKIESGLKESFEGTVAIKLRGEQINFAADATSNIEIRSIQ